MNSSSIPTNKVESAHNDSIWSVSWIPSQDGILTGSLDGHIRLWDGSLSPIGVSPKQLTGVTSVVPTSDGTMAIACFQDSVIRFYSLPTLEEIGIIDAGLLEAWTICLSPHDDVLVAGNHRGAVNIWSMQEGRELVTTLETNNKFILSTAFSPDLKLATAGIDGNINIFDITTRQIIHQIGAHALPARCVTFSQQGNLVFSASDDRHVSVFDVVSGTVINTFSHAGMCLSVDTSPDHRHFVVGCSDSKVLLWDLGMQKFIRSYDQHKDQVWGVSYNKQDTGRKFASVGDDYLLQIYE